jgi:O-antigen/teichoic acid export membrane protein
MEKLTIPSRMSNRAATRVVFHNSAMRSRLLSEYSNFATPAALLIAARIANMVLGLAVIPVLLTFLGTEHFAAWALLLALGAAFSLLELSMPPTYVRAAAPLIHGRQMREARQVTANALCIVFLSFGIASVPLIATASMLVRAVGLPDGELLSATELVIFVFIAASLRALLQFGSHKFNAARKFGALAASSFLQSFSSNLAAALAAIITGKLEYVVISFWIAQLLALTAVNIATRITLPDEEPDCVAPSRSGMHALLKHALPLQVYDWAQVVSYQFDKFVIAAIAGLPSVALYEVGNRSVLALRSIPSSGIDSFLATASIGQADRHALWEEYVRMMQLTCLTLFLFVLAPVAVAPMMLYAWTGIVGYEARWVFGWLATGASFGVISLPAAAMIQSAGRSDIQARAALLALLINIPLSILLTSQFGTSGAAAASALSMCLSALGVLTLTHRLYRKRIVSSRAVVTRFASQALIALALAGVIWWLFQSWLNSLPEIGDAASRAKASVAAMVAYVCIMLGALSVTFRTPALQALAKCFARRTR